MDENDKKNSYMKCIICNSESKPFLTKDFGKTPYSFIMKGIGLVDYHKCSNCGFTLSKTHANMDNQQWVKINSDFHHYLENNITETNQPPYIEQAIMLKLLQENQIINLDSALDFAGGYGTLSKILKKYLSIDLSVYDPYVKGFNKINYVKKEELKKYDVLINSALFEHLYTRESFDEINNLVSDSGFMIIHTVICENIPKDVNWFYMEPPVHCAFHTNMSMSILMKQWNYQASIYCPSAKSWILIKKEDSRIKDKIETINGELQTKYFIYKDGFVDYWKGF